MRINPVAGIYQHLVKAGFLGRQFEGSSQLFPTERCSHPARSCEWPRIGHNHRRFVALEPASIFLRASFDFPIDVFHQECRRAQSVTKIKGAHHQSMMLTLQVLLGRKLGFAHKQGL
ncbi:hypothetical protein NYF14_09675 [Sphingobium sp. 10 DY56-G10]|nr:hypothetical protein SKA58_12045 [Sphingomonas sp. SKA58]